MVLYYWGCAQPGLELERKIPSCQRSMTVELPTGSTQKEAVLEFFNIERRQLLSKMPLKMTRKERNVPSLSSLLSLLFTRQSVVEMDTCEAEEK